MALFEKSDLFTTVFNVYALQKAGGAGPIDKLIAGAHESWLQHCPKRQ